MKPKIRVLPDGEPGYERMHWCGLFDGGYSSLGPVAERSLEWAIHFYKRIWEAEHA